MIYLIKISAVFVMFLGAILYVCAGRYSFLAYRLFCLAGILSCWSLWKPNRAGPFSSHAMDLGEPPDSLRVMSR